MLDQSSVGRLSRMDAMQQQAMASSQLGTLQHDKQRLTAAAGATCIAAAKR